LSQQPVSGVQNPRRLDVPHLQLTRRRRYFCQCSIHPRYISAIGERLELEKKFVQAGGTPSTQVQQAGAIHDFLCGVHHVRRRKLVIRRIPSFAHIIENVAHPTGIICRPEFPQFQKLSSEPTQNIITNGGMNSRPEERDTTHIPHIRWAMRACVPSPRRHLGEARSPPLGGCTCSGPHLIGRLTRREGPPQLIVRRPELARHAGRV
jgi:hypothetical protein